MKQEDMKPIDYLILCILNDESVDKNDSADKYRAMLESKYGLGVFELDTPTVKEHIKQINQGAKNV